MYTCDDTTHTFLVFLIKIFDFINILMVFVFLSFDFSRFENFSLETSIENLRNRTEQKKRKKERTDFYQLDDKSFILRLQYGYYFSGFDIPIIRDMKNYDCISHIQSNYTCALMVRFEVVLFFAKVSPCENVKKR